MSGTSAIDHLREIAPNLPMQALRDFLGKWYVPGDRAFENIDGFSGGEKAPKLNPQKLAKAEAQVAQLEARLAQIETELAAPDAYLDGGKRATDLGREQQALRGQLKAAEAELLAFYE